MSSREGAMKADPAVADFVLSLDDFTDRSLRTRIAGIALSRGNLDAADDKPLPLIRIEGARGQAHALMAIRSRVRLRVTGSVGDYSLSHGSRCEIRVDGSGGHGIAECLEGGAIGILGDVGHGVGVGMRSGTLAVYGHAGDRVGAAMMAGELFVRGNVGADCGVGMRGGTMVVGGDAGPRLGEPRGTGMIFLRGRAESLAEGMVEVPLRKRDELRLGVLLINAEIRGLAKDFRRVISETAWRQEESKVTGEMRPNWR
ncbi:MAG: tributyrin esterase [Planctomycetaceae bacterium]|nr:MAG: tributyrin esterase [Planctomycetaceae bacterium]